MRNAMNEVTRLAYIRDCDLGVKRWNRIIERAGIDFRVALPHERFHRAIGQWAGHYHDPAGKPLSAEAFAARAGEWLPTAVDRAFVKSLMQPVTEPGKVAAWIAPPEKGVNNLPVDYEYVHVAG